MIDSQSLAVFRNQLRMFTAIGAEIFFVSLFVVCMSISKTYQFLWLVCGVHAVNLVAQFYVSVGMLDEPQRSKRGTLAFYERGVIVAVPIVTIWVDLQYIVCSLYGFVHCFTEQAGTLDSALYVLTSFNSKKTWCVSFYDSFGLPEAASCVLLLLAANLNMVLVGALTDIFDSGRDGMLRFALVCSHLLVCAKTGAWVYLIAHRYGKHLHILVGALVALEGASLVISVRKRAAGVAGLACAVGVVAGLVYSKNLGVPEVKFVERWGLAFLHGTSALVTYGTYVLFWGKAL